MPVLVRRFDEYKYLTELFVTGVVWCDKTSFVRPADGPYTVCELVCVDCKRVKDSLTDDDEKDAHYMHGGGSEASDKVLRALAGTCGRKVMALVEASTFKLLNNDTEPVMRDTTNIDDPNDRRVALCVLGMMLDKEGTLHLICYEDALQRTSFGQTAVVLIEKAERYNQANDGSLVHVPDDTLSLVHKMFRFSAPDKVDDAVYMWGQETPALAAGEPIHALFCFECPNVDRHKVFKVFSDHTLRTNTHHEAAAGGQPADDENAKDPCKKQRTA